MPRAEGWRAARVPSGTEQAGVARWLDPAGT